MDMIAWVNYSAQGITLEYWISGNGEFGDKGWVLNKTILAGLTKNGMVFNLTIHGTGP